MALFSSLRHNSSFKFLTMLSLAGMILAIGDRCNAMTIEGWSYDPEKGQIEFEIEDGVKPRHFLMAQPARIVVDLQNTQIGSAPPEKTYTSGPIQRITVEQLQPQLTRVTLYMFPSTVFAKGQVSIERLGDGSRGLSDVWQLRPLIKPLGFSNGQAGLEAPSPAPNAPLQIKTETQTLIQTPNPAPQPIAQPVSQSIPIAFPAAKADVPSIASRFANIQPATPPKLEEMPPGMAAVIKTPAATPAKSTVAMVNPFELPAKLETVKPAPKPEVKSEPIKISVPPANSVNPVIPPPALNTLAKAENIVVPESLPMSVPTTVTQPTTVSVPPLSTIVTPVAKPPVQTPPQPASTNPFPAQPFPLPDKVPQTAVQSNPQPPTPVDSFAFQQPIQNQSQNQSQSLPIPDRIPTAIPSQTNLNPAIAQPVIQPVVQPIQQQPSIFTVTDRNTLASNPASSQPNVISFGQPLITSQPPMESVMSTSATTQASTFATVPNQSGTIVAMNSNDGRIGLPVGTSLTVKYTGISAIRVKGEAHREMLVLQSAVRDRNGSILVPAGSTIYGNFIDNRFVAEAIVLQGQTFALPAQSAQLGGSRTPSEGSLIQNSGIGLLAGVLIGGLTGGSAVGGAAAGAIVSYATAPKVATIQSGQTMELKLTQDWILPFTTSVSQAVGG